jgi:hypothetical protein
MNSQKKDAFSVLYPNIAAWVEDGWVEIGNDEFSSSMVRALDIGGMVWEGESSYPSLHEALKALDAGIAEFLEVNQ